MENTVTTGAPDMGSATGSGGAPADFFAELSAAIDGPGSLVTDDTDAPTTDVAADTDVSAGADDVIDQNATEDTAPASTDGVSQDDAAAAGKPADGKAADAAATDQLPQGVTAKDTAAGRVWEVPETQARDMFSRAELAQKIEEIIGEPLTVEAVQLRERTLAGSDMMFTDFTSLDPTLQGNVIRHFVQMGDSAVQNGQVSQHPMVSMARIMPQILEQTAPDAHAALMGATLTQAIRDLEADAKASGNEKLFYSLQHINKKLGFPTRKSFEDVPSTVPKDARLADVERREQALNQNVQERQQGEWSAAVGDANRRISDDITNSVTSAFDKQVAERWKEFPETWGSIQEQLKGKVKSALKSDTQWQSGIKLLERQAMQAVKPEVRAALLTDIVTRHNAKVTSLVKRFAGPILNEAMQLLQAKETQSRTRAEKGRAQSPTGSGNAPTRRTITDGKPRPTDPFEDIGQYRSELDAVLS